jgi:DNA-directed RNA polymerase alpha subunit
MKAGTSFVDLLSASARRALLDADIVTVEELAAVPDTQARAIRGIGPLRMREIEQALHSHSARVYGQIPDAPEGPRG